ncbi:hypothetical protein ABZX99_03015 [Streptomyces antibioticus]|uniref:hypothetical protein n=1 Tax=Streptomyces antibioticus TaxID=1890 RepID=UPI0033A5790C
MDPTQTTAKKNPGTSAMLVTSLALGSGNVGFMGGIFASLVGELSLYEATGAGSGFGAAAFAVGLSAASFVRNSGEA